MKRILVVHPQFQIPGGAELVALHIINYILRNTDSIVDLLTLTPVNWTDVTYADSIGLDKRRITNRIARCPNIVKARKGALELLKLAYLHRDAKKMSPEYDLCVSTYNEIDFGRKGIQYCHHPIFPDRRFLQSLHLIVGSGVLDRMPALNAVYRRLVFKVSRGSLTGFGRNLTIVNSEFMRRVMNSAYGIEGTVIYPGFLTTNRSVNNRPWSERRLRFVSVGRIARDKGYLDAIDAYASLSAEYKDAEFVIAGRGDDLSYEKMIKDRAQRSGIRLQLLKDLSDFQLSKLLSDSKFFVHTKVNEHFGIATIEAAAAGCLTMVHNSGASGEIVRLSQLMFDSPSDLVSKVKSLVGDPALSARTLETLQSGLERFTVDRFYANLDQAIGPAIDSAMKM